MRGDSTRHLLNFSSRIFFVALAMFLGLASCGEIVAQESPEASTGRFAPGVLTTIAPDVSHNDMIEVHDLLEIRADGDLAWDPNTSTQSRTLFELAKSVSFRRDIWCLEFAFKPLRMIHVDIPQPSGKIQRKLIWYLVYRVRNTGVALAPELQEDDTYKPVDKSVDEIRFIPQFVLSSQDHDRAGQRVRKAYLDRIIPTAVQAIKRRELPGGELLNSVQVSNHLLKLEDGRAVAGLWGVATWEDVDPQIDFFSVFVGGLTNAYQWQDAPDDFQRGDPAGKGRRFVRKQLQLNFWRPGDDLSENEREIRYGVAPGQGKIYGTNKGVAHLWVYR